jgi:HEPN domain-containing protein
MIEKKKRAPNPAGAKVWIEIAQSDLKSAQLLYALGQYRTSFFFFQQASEKATKALGIQLGILTTEKEIKELEHNPPKFFRRLAVDQQTDLLNKINNSDDLAPKLRKEYEEYEEGLAEVDKLYSKNLVDISFDDLADAKEQLSKLQEPVEDQELFKKMLLGMKNHDIEVQMIAKKLYQIFFADIPFYGLTIATCSSLTFNGHAKTTRYPTKGINPDNLYTIEIPLIKTQSMFMDTLQDALARMSIDARTEFKELFAQISNLYPTKK